MSGKIKEFSNQKAASQRNGFEELTDAWLKRWVLNKITKDGVLEKISSETFEKLAAGLRPNSYDEQYKRL